MKCQFCNNEIPNDSLFCPECGQKLNVSILEPNSCSICGTPLENDAMFCPECGTPCTPVQAVSNAPSIPTKKGKAPVIIITIIGAVILIAVLIAATLVFVPKTSAPWDISKKEDTHPNEDSGDFPEPSEEIDWDEVDYDLLEEDVLFLEGLLKKTESGDRILRWDNELTFYGEDFDGAKILLEDARSAYIDDSALPSGMLDSIKSNQTISIDGQLYFDNEKLYLTPFEILDEDGNDLISDFEKPKEQTSKSSGNDYILPQSDYRLLTAADVANLSIREINYAKNEIYARHGRLFKSPELQNYFDSKTWYHGTISPDSFNTSLLSDIELKNAEFLADVEFGMDSNGYQLDAN